MKIVFWSEEAACGTTSNMIATASMIVARHDCRVAMLSAEKNAHDLAGNFSRPDSVTVNEDCAYYALEGLDYLLMLLHGGVPLALADHDFVAQVQ